MSVQKLVKKSKKHYRPEKDFEEPGDSKPLKMVLKIGGLTPTASPSPASMLGAEDTPERKLKHKKKKKHKKEKRRRDDLDSDGDDNSQMLDEDSKLSELEDDDGDESFMETPALKKARIITEADFVSGRSLRERKQEDKKGPLFFLLDYMQRTLQRKDGSGIFAFPVTDQIAPRYSEIIKRPMDFSTMRRKLDSLDYNTVAEYKDDFRTMLENCMTYNHPDTIYYKEAQRLLGIGLKQLSKDRVMSLKRSLPNVAELSETELGDSEDEENVEFVEYKTQRRGQQDSKFSAIADHMTPDDVLQQVQAAARFAAEELAHKKPRSKVGFLRRNDDGSTCLNILNPDNDGVISEREKVVSLGNAVGKLKSGSHALAAFREDKRNKATPVSYLTYGSFSSYAPVFDSTTANVSKEESDLLLSTYADETGVQYSKSIRHFVEDCGDYAVKMVDNLLDILTQGQHSATLRFSKQEEEKRKEQEETLVEKLIKSEEEAKANDDNQEGSVLEAALHVKQEEDDGVQQDLDKTSELLKVLQRTQRERLAAKLTPTQPLPPQPSDAEHKLAQDVTDRLSELTKHVKPEDVVSKEGLRKAMGIEVTTEYVPIAPEHKPQTSTNQPESVIQLDDSQDSADLTPMDVSQESIQSLSQTDSDQPMSVSLTQPLVVNMPQSEQLSSSVELDETAAAVAGIL